MKALRLSLCLALVLVPLTASLQHPHPPGLEDPSKYAPPLEQPTVRPGTVQASQLHHDANELLQLSQSVSADINQASKGVLAKDLGEKLKRIEKLSKKLRSELAL